MIVTNSNRFPLPGTNNRFIHLATVAAGIRQYICFFDSRDKKMYIEEATSCNLEFIEDEVLVQEINDLLFRIGVTNLKNGLPMAD